MELDVDKRLKIDEPLGTIYSLLASDVIGSN
jgi:hypothetical protein